MLALFILQPIVLLSLTYYSGTFSRLYDNSYTILDDQVASSRDELENIFYSYWLNISPTASSICSMYDSKYNFAHLEGSEQTTMQKSFLLECYPTLVRTLRHCNANGIFLVLNSNQTYTLPTLEQPVSCNGLCIRDLDPHSNYVDTEDLIIERAPASLISSIGGTLDSWWHPTFTFSDGNSFDYYFKPLHAAFNNPDAAMDDLTYLSGPHHLTENDTEMISYSLPLIDSSGHPFGVLGLEISTEYVISIIDKRSSEAEDVAYMIAHSYLDSDNYEIWAKSGSLYEKVFGDTKAISINKHISGSCYTFASPTEKYNVMGSLHTVSLYEQNTPFQIENLSVIKLVNSDKYLKYIDTMQVHFFIAAAVSLIVGIIAIIFICHRITIPIQRLSHNVEAMSKTSEISYYDSGSFSLDKINIAEIDQLTASIEALNKTININHAKSEFFSRMSHDMRTPMNAVIGFSAPEMLETTTEAEKLEYLRKINESGKYLLGLINEILDISKIESNKLDIQYIPSHITQVWDIVIPMIEELALTKDITFVHNCDELDRSIIAQMDVQRMNQIFMNLLSNAVKYTPENGHVDLIITTISRDSESITQQFIIRDNGVGMSDSFKAKLFNAFEQENPGLEGSGLGLSIAKSLIELMGGTIECDSVAGEGTTFTVVLTSKICKKQEMRSAEDTDTNTLDIDKILSGRHVLLCEDHPINTQIATRLLSKKNITFDCAENGKKGVERFLDSPPFFYDAILMDIRMPEMDGITATKIIRSLSREDSSSTPIIAMTANAFDEDIRACFAAGMNAHVAKPISPAILFNAIAEQLADN